MSNVTNILHAMPLSPEINRAIVELDSVIAKAVDVAKVEGLPQGLVEAVLHCHAHSETAKIAG